VTLLKQLKSFSFILTVGISMLIVVGGCKRTKDSFTSRTYHEMTSRFNPLFNGNEALRLALIKVENEHADNFAEVLPVYKWPDEKSAATIAADMDRAMEKAVKVITNHGMAIGGDQKNDYIDDSYFLIGQARFYKREFFSSLETFNYILQQYDEGDLAYNARLWAAKCKIQIGNPAGAKADLEWLYNDQELPKGLKEEVLATMAQMNIGLKKWNDVAVNLQEAVEVSKKKTRRVRYAFIRGQALEMSGQTYEASEVFYSVVKMRPSYDFYFHSQLNRARNFDVFAKDPNIVYDGLTKMVKDEKNIENRDQIYYVMAEVALKEEEFSKAEDYLKLSIRNSKANQTQKALSYLKIGEINFDFQDYRMAQAYYDSSASIFPNEHPRFEEVNKRAAVLNRMVDDLNTIEMQDSLQRLAGLDAATQRRIAESIVEDLISREEAEREAEALAELNKELAETNAGMPTGPIAGGGPNAGKWYFYNTNLVSKGRSAFKRKFGERPDVDNWAQRNRMRTGVGPRETVETNESDSTETSEPEQEASTDPYMAETYLALIPSSEEDFEKSNGLIREAYIDLGLVYKDGLLDVPKSIRTYEELLSRYSEFKERPRVLYTLFLLYREQGDAAKSDTFRQDLIENYAGTEFAILAANDGVPLAKEDDRPCLLEYERAYRYFKDQRYRDAEGIAKQGMNNCSDDALSANYHLLYALCLGGRSNRTEMVVELKSCFEKYRNSDVGAEAKRILDQLGEMSEETAATDSGDGSKDTQDGSKKEDENSPYTKNPKSKHRYMMLIKGKSAINDLQIAFSDHNNEFHRFQKLNQQILPLNQEIMAVVVTGFKNEASAMAYKKALFSDPRMAGVSAGMDFSDSIISRENFTYFFKNKDLEGYDAFYKKNYKTN
jgi:tetratricopeptide (TPR) repeat protein